MSYIELMTLIIECLKCMEPSVAKCWDYHCQLEKNMNTLMEKMKALKIAKDDLIESKQEELVSGKIFRLKVRDWLDRVEAIEKEIERIKVEKENVKCYSCTGLGKKVLLKISEVEKLLEEGKFSDGIVISCGERGKKIPTAQVLEGKTTFMKYMSEISAFTNSNEVRKVGVFGMSGVGKTTVLKHINNRLVENSPFDHVIWVDAAKLLDVASIQERIAQELNIDISECRDERTRATQIFKKFSTKKNYVLILDDLLEPFQLENVGIPMFDVKNRAKLLLTAPSRNICSGMGCDRVIEMGPPPEEEALSMLLHRAEKTQDEISAIPELEKTLMDVVRECGCLPWALVAIADKLKCDHCTDWRVVLQNGNFVRSSTRLIIDKMKSNYHRMTDDAQQCLLYCVFYPDGYPIEVNNLIHHLIAERIIDEKMKRESDTKKGHWILKKHDNTFCSLKKIKINNQEADCYKVHSLSRIMAMEIISSNHQFLIQAGKGLKHIPSELDWSPDLVKVSLINNNISEIPSTSGPPQCPKLSTLLLSGNILKSIASEFFAHMKGLSVLDLSHTGIVALPRSVSDLELLTALFLRECRDLRFVPSLAKLQRLTELDFYFSGIEQLPDGTENLVKLKYINLSGSRLELISGRILSNFNDLRCLSILSGCVEGPRLKAEELKDLKNLEFFQGELHDLSNYNAYAEFLSSKFEMSTYILQLGFIQPLASFIYDRVVFLTNCDLPKNECPLSLPKCVKQLAIKECSIKVPNLWELVSLDKVTNLECLEIKRCPVIKHLFSYSYSVFPVLEKLEVLDLEGMSDLCNLIENESQSVPSSMLLPGTFGSLKELRMFNCQCVKRLLPVSSLPKLEVLTISLCDQLEEIIMSSEQDRNANDIVSLPNLRTLILSVLPKLQSIPIISDSIEEIDIWSCPKLTRIPLLDRENVPTNLKRVNIFQSVWRSLKWVHENTKNSLQDMFQKQNEMETGGIYYHHYPAHFDDENPNACSTM